MKRFLRGCAALVLTCAFAGASAQEIAVVEEETAISPLSQKQSEAVIKDVTGDYTPWTTASWKGKVTSPLLPAKVNVKVSMEAGKLTVASVSVPLFGEVARIEIDNEGALAVNKVAQTYYRLSFGNYSGIQSLHSDIQNLLLGRAVVLGKGVLSKKLAKDVTIYGNGDNGYMIVPFTDPSMRGVEYGYTVSSKGELASVAVVKYDAAKLLEDIMELQLECYAQLTPGKDKHTDARLTMTHGSTTYQADIDGGEITYGGAVMDRFNLPKSYREVQDIRQLMKF